MNTSETNFNFDIHIRLPLLWCNLENEFTVKGTDDGSTALREIWVSTMKEVIANNYDKWNVRKITLSSSPPDVPEGWSFVPSDYLELLPENRDNDSYQLAMHETGRFMVKMAGQSFTYIFTPKDISGCPVLFIRVIQRQFLADIADRFPSIEDRVAKFTLQAGEQYTMLRKNRSDRYNGINRSREYGRYPHGLTRDQIPQP